MDTGEAVARPCDATDVLGAVFALEDVWFVGVGDADAGVGDDDLDLRRRGGLRVRAGRRDGEFPDGEVDLTASGRVLDRVADEVVDHAFEKRGVRDDDEFRRRQVEGQLETRPGRLRLEFVESVVHEVVEPDLGRLRATDVAVVLRDLRVDVHDVFDRLHIVERLDRRRVPVVVRIVAQELGDAVDVREVVRDVMARRAEEDAQFLHAA